MKLIKSAFLFIVAMISVSQFHMAEAKFADNFPKEYQEDRKLNAELFKMDILATKLEFLNTGMTELRQDPEKFAKKYGYKGEMDDAQIKNVAKNISSRYAYVRNVEMPRQLEQIRQAIKDYKKRNGK